ncbi:MAG: sulfite reductase subunit alpha [Verrucomicrobiota bacterium]
MSLTIPTIPESAPFSEAQRHWLNGYLVGLFAAEAKGGEQGAVGVESEKRGRVVLMYGSQSGNAQGLCEGFGETLEATGWEAPVFGMEDHEEVDLAAEELVLLVSSTWGDGDPPDNAVAFWKRLGEAEAGSLGHLKYSVLALGDTNYADFCEMGKRFDARMAELGAERMVDRVDCDVDFEDAAEVWMNEVTGAMGVESQEEVTGAVAAGDDVAVGAAPAYSKKRPFGAALLVNRCLNGAGSERDTRHFEIGLAGSGLSYEVGDVLGVYPENCPDLVEEVLGALGFDGEEAVPDADGEEVSIRMALRRSYGITVPGTKFMAAVAERSGDGELAGMLEPEGKDALASFLWGREVIDLLFAHAGLGFSAGEFVALLGKLNPRLYSIASSPKAHPEEVHLTVATVTYESHGRARKGVCSTYLAERVGEGGAVPVFLQGAKHFKLPEDMGRRVIMVGPGTGIAPFRAFLEERRETGASGENWLFFGNPHAGTDFLYREELEAMRDGGALHRLDTAWSRDQGEKVYVQHRMRERGAELWGWLEEGAHFYVCGDAKRMAKDVDEALRGLIEEHGGKSGDEAEGYVATMKKEKRYQRDVY